MKKQTAVEWFITNIAENGLFNVSTSDAIKNLNNSMKIEELEEQAKEMEKEQVIDAVSKGWDNYEDGKVRWIGEQYYNDTFKNK
jgi:hypothetical protein